MINAYHGDCLDLMAKWRDAGVLFQSVVCDPPYHLTSVVQRFGKKGSKAAGWGTDGAYARASAGFMGKTWDGGDIALRSETWRLCWDLLPPGGHLVAFGGTRTFHRMTVAIEDAGFEIRDVLSWLYGTGFPKSPNLKDEWTGWALALKPAWEPIILARKPLDGTVANTLNTHGVGAINVDACRVPCEGGSPSGAMRARGVAPSSCRPGEYGDGHAIQNRVSPERWLQARSGEDLGRWPANVVHDGSEEVEAAFAEFGERPGQISSSSTQPGSAKTRKVYGLMKHTDDPMHPRDDSGTASRFFYSAKAGKDDRAGSKHPTVKPVALMRWLVRMVTPPGGTVLDPFAGSGTTGAACHAEGFACTMIEQEAEYIADIRRRLGLPSVEDMLL